MARSRHLRRGIYLLPTLFTVGNLFCGYSAVVLASQGAVSQAALLIIVAGVLDGLDGRLARLTGTTSAFGLQFDSLADIVSFGVAPAVLSYQWSLRPLDRLGWLVAFIFVVCAAMRLARFNIQAPRLDKRYFAGLPSPPAAGALACAVFAFPAPNAGGMAWVPVVTALYVAALALLMVSRFRYRSFKEFDLRNRRSYTYVLPVAGVIVAIAVNPRWSMLVLAAAYVLSAPAANALELLRRRDVAVESGSDVAEVVDEPASR